MEKTAYLPGESGEIVAYFHTGTFSGKVAKNIRVFSNTAGSDIIRLSFSAEVVSDLKPSTTSLYFRDVLAGQVYEKDVFIQNNMPEPLDLKSFTVQGDNKTREAFPVDVQLKRNEDGLEYLNFIVRPKADMTTMQHANLSIDVETNSEKSPRMTFYLIVRMLKPIEIQPTSLFLFGVKANQSRVRRIQIKSNLDKTIRVVDIKCDNPQLKFDTIEESETLTHIWVGTTGTSLDASESDSGTFNSIIHIRLMVGDEEESFKVPVRGSIVP